MAQGYAQETSQLGEQLEGVTVAWPYRREVPTVKRDHDPGPDPLGEGVITFSLRAWSSAQDTWIVPTIRLKLPARSVAARWIVYVPLCLSGGTVNERVP
jgi:hypothetical protein